MTWYYAVGTERKGPVEEAELLRLLAAGEIAESTLVWNAGLKGWIPIAETALPTAATGAAGSHICIITGRATAESEMIKTEHGWVSAEGKDTYYQALREGIAPALAGAGVTAWRDGRRLVIPVRGARLPARCVKTNTPVAPGQYKAKKLYWTPPAIYLALLVNILVVIILSLIFRKKVEIDMPLGDEGRARLRANIAISIAGALTGIGLVAWAFASGLTGELVWLAPGGFVVILAALVFANFKANALRVTRVRDGRAWLAGACPEFLASLPPYSG